MDPLYPSAEGAPVVLSATLKLKHIAAQDGLFSWRPHVFKLDVGRMTITCRSASPSEAAPQGEGTYDLSLARSAKAWASLGSVASAGFDLAWKSGRVWSLLASSGVECRQWVEQLNRGICRSASGLSSPLDAASASARCSPVGPTGGGIGGLHGGAGLPVASSIQTQAALARETAAMWQDYERVLLGAAVATGSKHPRAPTPPVPDSGELPTSARRSRGGSLPTTTEEETAAPTQGRASPPAEQQQQQQQPQPQHEAHENVWSASSSLFSAPRGTPPPPSRSSPYLGGRGALEAAELARAVLEQGSEDYQEQGDAEPSSIPEGRPQQSSVLSHDRQSVTPPVGWRETFSPVSLASALAPVDRHDHLRASLSSAPSSRQESTIGPGGVALGRQLDEASCSPLVHEGAGRRGSRQDDAMPTSFDSRHHHQQQQQHYSSIASPMDAEEAVLLVRLSRSPAPHSLPPAAPPRAGRSSASPATIRPGTPVSGPGADGIAMGRSKPPSPSPVPGPFLPSSPFIPVREDFDDQAPPQAAQQHQEDQGSADDEEDEEGEGARMCGLGQASAADPQAIMPPSASHVKAARSFQRAGEQAGPVVVEALPAAVLLDPSPPPPVLPGLGLAGHRSRKKQDLTPPTALPQQQQAMAPLAPQGASKAGPDQLSTSALSESGPRQAEAVSSAGSTPSPRQAEGGDELESLLLRQAQAREAKARESERWALARVSELEQDLGRSNEHLKLALQSAARSKEQWEAALQAALQRVQDATDKAAMLRTTEAALRAEGDTLRELELERIGGRLEEEVRAACEHDQQAALSAQALKHEAELASVTAEAERRLEAEVERVRAQAAMREREIARDVRELQELHQKRLAHLERMAKDEGRRLVESRRELATLQLARAADRNDMQRLEEGVEAQKAETVRQAAQYKAALEASEGQKQELRQQLAGVEEQVRRLDQELRLAKSQVGELKRQLAALVVENDGALRAQKVAEARAECAARELQIAQEEVAMLEADVGRGKRDNAALAAALAKLDKMVYGSRAPPRQDLLLHAAAPASPPTRPSTRPSNAGPAPHSCLAASSSTPTPASRTRAQSRSPIARVRAAALPPPPAPPRRDYLLCSSSSSSSAAAGSSDRKRKASGHQVVFR